MLHLVECGKVSDFSMVLRGEIRTAHRNSTGLSAGEKELAENGFPFPEDLVKKPIALTCPEGGIVLDPFVGTGATCRVAQEMGRKSVGIESSAVYMKLAREGRNGNASF